MSDYMHVYYGYSKHKRDETDPDDYCFRCGAKPDILAYTYFGGGLCQTCWDGYWLHESEDGQCDPPFDEINRAVSGEWVELPGGESDKTD